MNNVQEFRQRTREAMIESRHRDPAGALRGIRAARRLLPDEAALALAAGECYEALGDVIRAQREYVVALSLDPELEPARAHLEAIDGSSRVAREIANAILEDSQPLWVADPAPIATEVASALHDGAADEPPVREAVVSEPIVLHAAPGASHGMQVLVAEEAHPRPVSGGGSVDLARIVREARDEALAALGVAGAPILERGRA